MTYPVRKKMCATCPFREGVPKEYSRLRGHLAMSALTEASRICHNTGSNNAFHEETGKEPELCRGARNVQIEYFHAIGFIDEPTDEAWFRKLDEIRRNER